MDTNNQRLIVEAFKLGGIAEVDGPKSNPRLLEILQRHHPSASDDSTTAWCAIMIGELFDRLGLPKPEGYVSARSWLKTGKAVEITEAQPGDLVIFSRPPSTWQGHVAIYAWHNETHVMVYGGNQSNKVGFSAYPRTRVLGLRRI